MVTFVVVVAGVVHMLDTLVVWNMVVVEVVAEVVV